MPKQIFHIADEDFWYKIEKAFERNGGIYILFSQQNDSIVPITRFLGNDEDGILYIGKADCFLDRVIDLKKSISPNYKSSSHECGVRWKKHKEIRTKFPFESLYVELTSSNDSRKLESTILKNYENKFGELPPLNRVQ